MTHAERNEKINLIKENKLSAEALSWEDFQEIVAEIIIRDYLRCTDCTVSDRKRRPIDIIIEKNSIDKLDINKKYYIECKNHAAKLSLETIGKVFCVAIKDMPDALMIVNKHKELDRDAKEYGNWLFNDFILKDKKFIIATIDELLGKDIAPVKKINYEKADKIHISISDFSYIRKNSLHMQTVCSKNSYFNKLEYFGDYKYYLEVVFSIDTYTRRRVNSVTLRTKTKEGNYHYHKFNIQDDSNDTLRATLYMNEIIENYLNLDDSATITITSTPGDYTFPIAMPTFLMSDSIVISDIRSNTTKKLVNMITESYECNVVFIRGEGGVGKTHLAKKMCDNLTSELLYSCEVLTISETTTPFAFLNLLWSIMLPNNKTIKSINRREEIDFIKDFMVALLEKIDLRSDKESIANDLMSENLSEEALEAVIGIIAFSICKTAAKKAIVLTNCQYFSNTALRVFRQLLAQLDSYGWNNTKIICEYRDTEDQLTERWKNCVTWINNGLNTKSIEIKLTPFNQHEIYNMVAETFNHENPRELTEILLTKTGGNALYLTHLLEVLFESKIIKKSSILHFSTLLEIESLTSLKNSLESLPSSVSALLKQRILYLDKDFAEKNILEDLLCLLGISSSLGIHLREDMICTAFELESTTYNILVSNLIQRKILTKSIDGKVMFSHDVVRICSHEAGKENEKIIPYAYRMINKTTNDDLESIYAKANLSSYINNNSMSSEYYEIGYQRSVEKNLFDWQYSFAEGEYKLFNKENILPKERIRKYFEIIENLAWAEEHVGSHLQAFSIIVNGLNKIEIYSDYWSKIQLNDLKAVYFHKLISLCILLLYTLDFLKYGKSALSHVNDLTKLGQILNRIILHAFQTNNLHHGEEIACIALRLAPLSKDKSVYSVLCTDIAMLYSCVCPEHSFEVMKKTTTMKVDKRQDVHNRLNLIAAKIRVDPSESLFQELVKLELDAINYRMLNILPKIKNINGCLCAIFRDIEDSIESFLHAEHDALLRDNKFQHLQIISNIIVCSFVSSKREMSSRFISKGLSILSKFIDSMNKYNDESIQGLVDIIESRFSSQLNANTFYDKTYISSTGLKKCVFFQYFISNMRNIEYILLNEHRESDLFQVIREANSILLAYDSKHHISWQSKVSYKDIDLLLTV